MLNINTDFITDINWKFLLLTEMSVVIVSIYFFEVDVYYFVCNVFVALQSCKSFKTYLQRKYNMYTISGNGKSF